MPIKTVALKKFGSMFIDAFTKHDLMTLAAALAFYTALSLAPLLMITLSVVGLLGESSQQQFLDQVHSLIGAQAADAITAVVQSGNDRPELGSITGIIGAVVLIFSASGVFAQLQSSLNVIWSAQSNTTTGAWGWIRKRLLSMGMVITLGFLSVVSLVVSSVLTFVMRHEGAVWDVANFLISFAAFSAMFTLILKYLPDAKLDWRSAFTGGAITALLFTIGRSLIGVYLGSSALGSSYGAAGSLIILLAWVYYSSIILFTGAEITRLLNTEQAPPKI